MDTMSIAVLVVLGAVAVAFVLVLLPAVFVALLLRACRQPRGTTRHTAVTELRSTERHAPRQPRHALFF